MRISDSETVPGGTCKSCGAVYLLDPTGKNVGEVMMQGLALAANRISKDMSEMVPGEDYDEKILSYDWRTHRSVGETRNFLDRNGRLYVIKTRNTKS